MATSYPTGYDAFNNPSGTDNLNTAGVVHSAQHTNVNDAVKAMQAELGLTPSGADATVVARLDRIEGAQRQDDLVLMWMGVV